MQRFLALGAGVLLFLLGMVFLGCGGGGATGPTVSIALSPSAVSLTRGGMAQITAQALDANNNPIANPTLAYHSSNPGTITVSNNGLICAGQWDANAVRCYDCSNPDLTTNACPANSPIPLPLGAASITATATVDGQTITSSAVVVTDHWPIDSVQVCAVDGTGTRTCPAPASACISQNLTAQYAAQAFSKDPVACQSITGSSAIPCRIPDGTQSGSTNTIGSINWQVSPPQVATADAIIHVPSEPVTVTAAGPGQGVVGASIGAAGSAVTGSTPFTTCAVASIHVQQQACTTLQNQPSITAPVGGTVPLLACVTDSKGIALTSTLGLTWLTSQPALASPSASTAQGATVQAVAPGTAAITAACLPPSCNVNMNLPIFSDDVVTATITGTVDSTVLVTTSTPPANSSSSNAIVPIDSSTNGLGTAFTLPANLQVNSMVLTPVGNPVFLGTTCPSGTTGPNGAVCSGLLSFNPTVATVAAPLPAITGKVLATDGIRVVLSDPANSQTIIATAAGPAIEKTLPIANATAAAFAIDGSKIYIVSGNNLYVYSPGLLLRTLNPPLGGSATTSSQGVAFFATGAMAYVADAAGDEAVVTCKDAIQSSGTASVGSPTHIAAVPNGSAMVDANSPNIDEIDVTSNGACPPVITPTPPVPIRNSFSSFTAHQLLVTNNSQLAIILADEGVLVYNLGTKQTSVISLGSGVRALSGGVTPDSANLYVGASDGKVHRVDLTKTPPTDAQSIAVSLCPSVSTGCTPDFVVVRPVATVATLSSLAVTPTNPTAGVGSTLQFTATGTFSDKTTRDMTNFVTWTSSNTVVAIIGPNTTVTPPLVPGQARGLAVGTSTISAASAGVSGSTTLTVQ